MIINRKSHNRQDVFIYKLILIALLIFKYTINVKDTYSLIDIPSINHLNDTFGVENDSVYNLYKYMKPFFAQF